MSVNAVTINSITTNLINILSGIERFSFEKDSESPEINTWVKLNMARSSEEENHGNGPMYIDQTYEIIATRQIEDKTDHRIREPEISWTVKEAITVAALNVADLLTSKLVTLVEIESDATDYESSEGLVIMIDLTVRFRDLRT